MKIHSLKSGFFYVCGESLWCWFSIPVKNPLLKVFFLEKWLNFRWIKELKNVPFIGELFPLHECKCTNICYSPIYLFSKFYISTLFVGYFFFFANKRNVFLFVSRSCLNVALVANLAVWSFGITKFIPVLTIDYAIFIEEECIEI